MALYKYLAIASVLSFGLAGCASTPDGDKEPELVVDGEEWECRRTKEIGRMIGKKQCASPQEWAKRDAIDQERAAETSRLIRERGSGQAPASGVGN